MENLFPWIVVGLLSGWLAAAVMGEGYGIVGDMVFGTLAAVVGGGLFHATRLGSGIGGMAGSTGVALVSAALLLASLRVFRRLSAR